MKGKEMTQIMTLMAFYYMCDQAAAHGTLNNAEFQNCMANYETIKLEFIDETPAPRGSVERAAQIRLGYVGFKAWEAANSDLVTRMRAKARAELGLS